MVSSPTNSFLPTPKPPAIRTAPVLALLASDWSLKVEVPSTSKTELNVTPASTFKVLSKSTAPVA